MRLGKKREAFKIDFRFSASPISPPPAALIFQFRLAILIQSAKEFKLLARISEEIRLVDGRNAGSGYDDLFSPTSFRERLYCGARINRSRLCRRRFRILSFGKCLQLADFISSYNAAPSGFEAFHFFLFHGCGCNASSAFSAVRHHSRKSSCLFSFARVESQRD